MQAPPELGPSGKYGAFYHLDRTCLCSVAINKIICGSPLQNENNTNEAALYLVNKGSREKVKLSLRKSFVNNKQEDIL